jgi:hypothetical protein
MEVPERMLPSASTKSRWAGNQTELATSAWKTRFGPGWTR